MLFLAPGGQSEFDYGQGIRRDGIGFQNSI